MRSVNYFLAARCGGPSARATAAGTLRTGYCEKVETNTISVEVMYLRNKLCKDWPSASPDTSFSNQYSEQL